MNKEMMNQLIKMAVKSAKRVNEAYSNNADFAISYSLGEFDSIIGILNFFQTQKFFSSSRDENHEKIKSISIKEYKKEIHSFITVETIEI